MAKQYLKATWEDYAGSSIVEIREYFRAIPASELILGEVVSEEEADKYIDMAQYVNDEPEFADGSLGHIWTYSPSGKVVLP